MRNKLIDLLQGASNAAASNISAPVDGVAWLLRKAGLNVQNPVGGSDWMAQRGLTREPQNRLAGILGESLGGVAPLLAAAKAPQIARGLLQGADNLMAPRTLNPQTGAIVWHGSNDSRPITKIKDDGVFGGLFASGSERSAASHGDAMYRMTVPDERIMGVGADIPWDLAHGLVSKNIRQGSEHADEITDMVINAKSAFNSSIPEDDLIRTLRASDLGEADWELQRLRGLLGRQQGFKAVEMPDEHGMSYLVLPGTQPRPANSAAKNLIRNGQPVNALKSMKAR
jgi:hypothetical protein